jgi:hypothetical protein
MRACIARVIIFMITILALWSAIPSGMQAPGARAIPSKVEAAAEASAPAPFWFSPIIDLVKWIFSEAKLGDTNKKKVDSTKPPIQSEAGKLQKLPEFLSSERDLRALATDLAKLAKLMMWYPSVADGEWQSLKVAIKQTNDAFNASYGNKDMEEVLESNESLQSAGKRCKDAINNIQQGLARTADSASPADKQTAINHLSNEFDELASCAQEPDSVVVFELHSFLESYQALTKPQGTAAKNPQGATAYQASEPTLAFAPIAWHRSNRTAYTKRRRAANLAGYTNLQANQSASPTNPVQGGTIYKTVTGQVSEPEYITQLRKEIASPVEPTQWMSDLAKAQSQLPAAPFMPWQAAAEGVLAALGVAAYLVRQQPQLLKSVGLLKIDLLK